MVGLVANLSAVVVERVAELLSDDPKSDAFVAGAESDAVVADAVLLDAVCVLDV